MSLSKLIPYWFIARSTDAGVPSAGIAVKQYKRLFRGEEFIGQSLEVSLQKLIEQNKVDLRTEKLWTYKWKSMSSDTEAEHDKKLIACLLEVDTCTRLLICLVYACALELPWERLQQILSDGNVLKSGKPSAFVWEMAWLSKLYQYNLISRFIEVVQSGSEGKSFFYGVVNTVFHLETVMNFLAYAEEAMQRNGGRKLFAHEMKTWMINNGQKVISDESDTEDEQNQTKLKQYLASISSSQNNKRKKPLEEKENNQKGGERMKQQKLKVLVPEEPTYGLTFPMINERPVGSLPSPKMWTDETICHDNCAAYSGMHFINVKCYE